MINPNNPGIAHLLATLKASQAVQGPTAVLTDALALTMKDTGLYAVQHSGAARTVAPTELVTAFHPHVIADTLALLRIVRGEPAPALQVYTDAWKPIDSIPVNSEDIERFDVAWAKPVPKAPAAPPPPPAPPAPPAIPQPPVAPATIAVPDTVLSALAALDGVVPVREAEEVIIPTTGQPAPILTLVSSQPLPPEKEHAGTPEPVAVVAQEPTRWYPGIPAPADIAPAGIPGKGRPKLSPFAKQHPPRKKVGSPSPFWRDMQPMIHGLFVLGPANCPPDNTLGTLESFTQLVHVVRGALGSLDQGATVGDVQNWLDDVWAQITESPAWPAIEASLVKYNAADSGEGDTE